MSSDREFTRVVRSWMEEGATALPDRVLDQVIARLPVTPQRQPLWRAWRNWLMKPRNLALAGAFSLVVVLALVAAGSYFGKSTLPPGGSATPGATPTGAVSVAPTPLTSPRATEAATATPTARGGRIVYERVTRIADGVEGACVTPSASGCTQWSTVVVANADGSEPRDITPGVWFGRPVSLSPDGSRLVIEAISERAAGEGYFLTDLDGTALQPLPEGGREYAFSPDGTRLAFLRPLERLSPDSDRSVIATMDLATGEVTELASTEAQWLGPTASCPDGCAVGTNEGPTWSPDSTRLLFTRTAIPDPDDEVNRFTTTYVVDADGSNLRQLVRMGMYARDAQWSADGELIVFTAAVEVFTGPRSNLSWHQHNDIYTIRADGTGLTRLTTASEGPSPDMAGEIGALRPSWTRDGRIVHLRIPRPVGGEYAAPELWVMDADGSRAEQLDLRDAVALTAAGCVACPYLGSGFGDLPSTAFWEPPR